MLGLWFILADTLLPHHRPSRDINSLQSGSTPVRVPCLLQRKQSYASFCTFSPEKVSLLTAPIAGQSFAPAWRQAPPWSRQSECPGEGWEAGLAAGAER